MSRPRSTPEVLSLVELNTKDSSERGRYTYSPYFHGGESTSSYSLDGMEKPYEFGGDTPSTAVEDPSRLQALLPLRGNNVRTTSRKQIYLPIILLWSTALLPGLMGVLFYISLGFNAQHGAFHPNGTYIRPVHEGIRFGDKDSFLTTHFSPLLLSSISSSLIGTLSSAVMGLLGYHLAVHWLRNSVTRLAPNPTPMQYYHTLDLISNSSPMACLRLLIYVMKQGWSRRRSAHKRDLGISKMLLIAGGALCMILTLDVAIRIIDVVLHSQIVSTIMVTHRDGHVITPAKAVIKAKCEDPFVNVCGVVTRTGNASLGGLNRSDIFRVYEHGLEDLERRHSVAFIGPVDPPTNLAFEADTLVASTRCEIYRPDCFFQDENTRVCKPLSSSNTPEPPESNEPWSKNVWTSGFNTTTWQMRLQAYLTVKGSLASPNASPPYELSSGSNVNPFTTASFGCFPNYGNILHSNTDTDVNFHTPFVNWWNHSTDIPHKPYPLCSISLCNTTVYDAKYNLSYGRLALDSSSFRLADATAAVAVSGAGMYLGTGDTHSYQRGPRFIDDQMQIDLSNAGNIHGNSIPKFSAAWAQAFSNRYLGWSAGMVELAGHPAKAFKHQLALSIPVVITYVFTVLHFVYALGLFLLGISCLVVARGDNAFRTDLNAAHQRLTDTAVLVQELAARSLHDQEMAEDASARAGDINEGPWPGNLKGGASVRCVPERRDLAGDSGTLYVDSEVSVGLRRRADGTLGLHMQRKMDS